MKTIIFITIMLLINCYPAQAAENWPMLNRDPSMSARTGDFVSGNAVKKWEKQFPQAAHYRAQPIVVNNIIYYATYDGTVRAINSDTGNINWSVNTNGVILGSPLVTAKRVIIPVSLGDRGELHAYSLTGSRLWVTNTPEPIIASPIAYQGMIVVGDLSFNLFSINAESGKIIWQKGLGGRVLGAAAAANDRIVVMADDMKGYAFDVNGNQLWIYPLPGETIREVHPVIAQGRVFFNTTPRANHYASLEDQPDYDEYPLEHRFWDNRPPVFDPPEDVLAANESFYQQNPVARSAVVVNLSDGKKAFDVALPSPYWGALTPIMLTEELALKFGLYGSFTINMRNGEIKFRGGSNTLLRRDEYTFSSVGGNQKVYGAVADDLGFTDYTNMSVKTLVNDFWSHSVASWEHPPNSSNLYLTAAGPGDGNSGYNSVPIPYDNKIIWLSSGSWLMVHQGTGGSVKPDTSPPSTPTNLHLQASDNSTITLGWNTSTDDTAVGTYFVFRNGTLVAETNTTKYRDHFLAPNTTYEYRVQAVDIHGKESAQSSALSAKTGTGSNTPVPPSPTATAKPGDANGDGKVDDADYAIWRTNYNQTKSGGASIGDFNNNGKVEGLDYVIWRNNVGI
jgi:chitodextrinase